MRRAWIALLWASVMCGQAPKLNLLPTAAVANKVKSIHVYGVVGSSFAITYHDETRHQKNLPDEVFDMYTLRSPARHFKNIHPRVQIGDLLPTSRHVQNRPGHVRRLVR